MGHLDDPKITCLHDIVLNGYNMSQYGVAMLMGESRDQVRYTEKTALNKLKDSHIKNLIDVNKTWGYSSDIKTYTDVPWLTTDGS